VTKKTMKIEDRRGKRQRSSAAGTDVMVRASRDAATVVAAGPAVVCLRRQSRLRHQQPCSPACLRPHRRPCRRGFLLFGWYLLFVLIRHGGGGGTSLHAELERLGKETGEPTGPLGPSPKNDCLHMETTLIHGEDPWTF